MIILSIETSCDETAISLVRADATSEGVSFEVLGNVTHSQIAVHTQYGGVFPMMGKREHQKNLVPILTSIVDDLESAPVAYSHEQVAHVEHLLQKEQVLLEHVKEMILTLPRPAIDRICVTSGPGLEPALWVGINFAKVLGYLWNIPVVPVNHMEGHILSVLVPQNPLLEKEGAGGGGTQFKFSNSIQFPALALLISGGHTELVLVRAVGDYEIIGKTRDDAVGEAFDKVARILGLPYPGGPEISRLAAEARRNSLPRTVELPRPMIHSKDYDFSFSGIKTAVLYLTKDRSTNPRITEAAGLSADMKHDIAREFENAAADVLVSKTLRAIEEYGVQTLIIGGGVAANTHIISEFKKALDECLPHVSFLAPSRELSTDNALMIALAGYFKIQKNPNAVYNDIRAEGNLSL